MFETEQKLRKARAGLILDQPFFGALALRLNLETDPSAGTAWTDGKSLGYDPAWIKGLTLDQVKGLWAHEVLHCACAHHVRRGQRDPQRWNLATDQAINHILINSGFTLPNDPQLDPQFRDKSAEEIYGLMGDQDPGPGGSGDDPGGNGAVKDGKGDQGQTLGPQDQAARGPKLEGGANPSRATS